MTMAFTRDLTGQAAQPVALSAGYWILGGSLVLTGSYAAGGDVLDLTPYFPAGKTIRSLVTLADIRGFSGEYDILNKKLKLLGLNPAAASLDVAALEHPAAAYNSVMTTGAIPVAFLMKG